MKGNLAEAILSKDDLRYYEIEMGKRAEGAPGEEPSRL